jgi:hypothetical protein
MQILMFEFLLDASEPEELEPPQAVSIRAAADSVATRPSFGAFMLPPSTRAAFARQR